jgi:hypothetical protein
MALVAVLVGILFLYLFMTTYDFKMQTGTVAMASRLLSLLASTFLSGV